MEYRLNSEYGLSLEQAVQNALATVSKEAPLRAQLRTSCNYVFDYCGIRVPVDSNTVAEELTQYVRDVCSARADWYDATPVQNIPYEREQGGRMGAHLDESLLPAVQCGQFWGNEALGKEPLAAPSLRHIFEFNGIKVPFNPWKEGEVERIREVVMSELAQKPASEYSLIVCR